MLKNLIFVNLPVNFLIQISLKQRFFETKNCKSKIVNRKIKNKMDFIYQDLYPILKDDTQYKKLTSDYVKVEQLGDREILTIDPKALELLAEKAMEDVSFMLRSEHLASLRRIIDDPEATDNDRFVAYNLLQNAAVAV